MAKKKGVQYTAQRLTKYFPKKYPSYTSALPKARSILSSIEKSGEKVTLKNIFSRIRTKRFTRSDALKLIFGSKGWKEIEQIQHYFDLISFSDYLKNTPNILGFVSKLLPATTAQPVMGGAGHNHTYKTLFEPYVNYCNSIKLQTAEEDKRYESDWLIKVTIPKQKGKIWISEVISVDGNGNEFDYGFDPKKPDIDSKVPILSGAEAPEAQEEEKSTPESPKAAAGSDQEFLLNLEREKQKTAQLEKEKDAARESLIDKMMKAGAPWKDIKALLK
ncbi:MAG: hypothetical protein V4506_16025 [Bacteroidota bacterium]